ncbi:MAG: hypothetical protein M1816_004250 [Peltula sp. TS41687]|nr:MAG: hypothetical protein M1816_004250 [Peltula sp. TS41687]
MDLIPVAPFPPANVRDEMNAGDWEACLDAWSTVLELHLQLSATEFNLKSSRDDSLITFLLSYMSENRTLLLQRRSSFQDAKSKALRRHCFLLVHRLLSEAQTIPPSLLQLSFLGQLSALYQRSKALRPLLADLWDRKSREVEPVLLKVKSRLIESLDSPGTGVSQDLEKQLDLLLPLFHVAPDIARVFLTGSELIDAASASYRVIPPRVRKRLLKVTYSGLVSLMGKTQPNFSLVFDHLYSLVNAQQEPSKGEHTLLVDLISETPLISHIPDRVEDSTAARAKPLIAKLQSIAPVMDPKSRRVARRRADKGKQRVDLSQLDDGFGHGYMNEIHVHRMRLISQIQDLFPDLGSGFIMKLLDEYGDDVEKVTAQLLDDSLPEHLRGADHHEDIDTHLPNIPPDLSPRPTPPPLPERRNVFDNDELDSLTVSSSRLHIGRKNPTYTAEDILNDRSTAPNKAAILSALAAFDSDDDERDDTYDMADVGGTVDSNNAEANVVISDQIEETLFDAYRFAPATFERDSTARKSQARAALRNETGMTDEAIEGWRVMLNRDSRMLRRLEGKYAGFDGEQRGLEPTAWRAGQESDDEAGNRLEGGSRRRGRGRGWSGPGQGRQRGGAGAGRGGADAGTSPARDGGGGGGSNAAGTGTERDRQRKETNKGSRANHNRRDQRAKKVARGMMGA